MRKRDEERIPPVHPGEILRSEFLVPLGLSQYKLARAIEVPAPRISEIVRGKRGITADTALRLGRYFGTSPDFWLNIQKRFELDTARDARGDEIDARVVPMKDRSAA